MQGVLGDGPSTSVTARASRVRAQSMLSLTDGALRSCTARMDLTTSAIRRASRSESPSTRLSRISFSRSTVG